MASSPPVPDSGDPAAPGLREVVDQLLPAYTAPDVDQADSIQSRGPNTSRITDALQELIDLLLPGRLRPAPASLDVLGSLLLERLADIRTQLHPELIRAIPFRWTGQAARTEGQSHPVDPQIESGRVIDSLFERLPTLRRRIIEDTLAAYRGDPAALTFAEVQLAYPGLLAIASHRVAHELYRLEVPIVPRIMSEWTHARTGVDIHPGATIGHGFFMDHATGIVIGETTSIGNRVKLYQGVTLGAKSFPLDEQGHPIKHIKRHPTVGDDVVIYANSTLLGPITIGDASTIGANVFLAEDVPPRSRVAAKHPELHIKTRS